MRIQNTQMRGATLGLRYTRDENGKPVPVTGDAEGVFDVPDRDGQFLLATPGWRAAKKAAATSPAPGPVAAEKPGEGDEEAEEVDEEAEEVDEDEGPDIDGLRTKAAALELAEKWRAKGYPIPELDADTMKLSEMQAALNEAIYGEGRGE